MYEALEQEHKGVPMLALAPEPEDLKKEPEPAAIVTAPWAKFRKMLRGRDSSSPPLDHDVDLCGSRGGTRLHYPSTY
jgi:hypothetical protein